MNNHSHSSPVMRRSRLAVALSTALGSLLAADYAAAQVLEEIVVTARFREESLQEIPVSISAISGSALEANGATDVVDIGDWAPNVVIDHLGAGWGPTVAASIRGIGYGDFKAVQEPTVTIYVDDVVLGRPTGAVLDLMDLERVEVLRGPQGTLFGKNAVGGTVRMISRKPNGDGPGSLELTRGEYNRIDVRGSFETTLVEDKLFGRVSFASKKRDGWVNIVDFACQMEANGTPQLAGINDGIGGWNDPDGAGPIVGTPIAAPVGSAADNTFSLPTYVSPLGTDKGCVVDTLGDENVEAARGILRFVPNDRFEINVAADFTDQQQKGPADYLQATVPTALVATFNNQTGLRRWGVPWDNRFVSNDPTVNYSSFINPIDGIVTSNINDVVHYGTSATFDWSLENDMAVKLIVAQREFEAQFGRDSDGSPLPLNHTIDTLRSDQFTAELRVSGTLFDDRTDWTAGVFYFDADDFNSNISILFPGQLPTSDIDRVDDQTTKNTGVFINTVTRLTDDLSLSVGLRQTSDEKTVTQVRYRRDETTLWVPRAVTTEADEVTPMVSLSYQANDNIMVYGTYQEGFRGGGANQRPANVNQVVAFGPEYLDNLEFGIKSDLGGSVRLNASIFDMTYTDMQLGAVTADATGAVAFLTANAGKATIQGIEIEVQGAIGEHWVLDGTLGTLDFQYKDLGAASAEAIQAAGLGTGLAQPSLDDVATRTPDYTASFGFNYLFNMPGGSSLTWRTSFSYQDDIFFGANNDPLSLAEGYTIANLRLTWVSANDEWEAALFGTNVTDELYVQSKLNFETSFGSIQNGYGRPEEWGMSVRKHF